MSKPLEFDSIGDLYQGRFRAEVNKAIRQAVMDCDDRPHLTNKRQVVITLDIVPRTLMDSTDLEGLSLSASVNPRLPKIKGGEEAMHVEIHTNEHGGREVHATFAQPTLLPASNIRIVPEGSN